MLIIWDDLRLSDEFGSCWWIKWAKSLKSMTNLTKMKTWHSWHWHWWHWHCFRVSVFPCFRTRSAASVEPCPMEPVVKHVSLQVSSRRWHRWSCLNTVLMMFLAAWAAWMLWDMFDAFEEFDLDAFDRAGSGLCLHRCSILLKAFWTLQQTRNCKSAEKVEEKKHKEIKRDLKNIRKQRYKMIQHISKHCITWCLIVSRDFDNVCYCEGTSRSSCASVAQQLLLPHQELLDQGAVSLLAPLIDCKQSV